MATTDESGTMSERTPVRRRLDAHPTWKHILIGLASAICVLFGLAGGLAAFTITRAETATARESDRAVKRAAEIAGEAKEAVQQVEVDSQKRDSDLEHKISEASKVSSASTSALKDDVAALKADVREVGMKTDRVILLLIEKGKGAQK